MIDWSDQGNNDFFLAQQMWVSGEMYKRRCDLLGFVNGIPLVFVELKGPHVPLKSAYDDNLKGLQGPEHPAAVPPQRLHPAVERGSQTASARADQPVGTLLRVAADRRRDRGGSTSLDTAIRGLCDKRRLLDLVENFTVFETARGGLIKKVARTTSTSAWNKAIAQMVKLRESGDREAAKKLGVFWHTQGSGKSLSMVFFTQKVLRQAPGKMDLRDGHRPGRTRRPDLQDLHRHRGDHQGRGAGHQRREPRSSCCARTTATSSAPSRNSAPTRARPAERSPTGTTSSSSPTRRTAASTTFALNMRNALPNAAFLGFTGTPLIAGEEERTREVFGDYVSIYDFARSIEDGATVPLYYENRSPSCRSSTTTSTATSSACWKRRSSTRSRRRSWSGSSPANTT